MKFYFRLSLIFIVILIKLILLYNLSVSSRSTLTNVNQSYSYYVCTQIYNESEHYLIDWLDHQFNVVGFKNVCLINTGQPLSISLRRQYPIAYVEKVNRRQEFNYCLSSCFVDEPMRPEDMLMVQDIDEYLNVRKADEIFRNYNNYDRFHFEEIRYGNFNCFSYLCLTFSSAFFGVGFVKQTEQEMFNQSLRTTNLWRKPSRQLGEYEEQNLQDLFNCTTYGGWPACRDGAGKQMIRVGAIKLLSVHGHKTNDNSKPKFDVDIRKIRLNHYMMRTEEDAIQSASKWNKLSSRIGQIALNKWFRIVFDDSILDSKRLI